jgi:pimeloyl-ACP methyl ester carboxylesterase
MTTPTLEREHRPFVREAGGGAGVVCIHSSASSSAQWRPLMDHLAGRFRVFAPDRLGKEPGLAR